MSLKLKETVSREEWKASEYIGDRSILDLCERIIIHHAPRFRAMNTEDGKIQVKAIQLLHQDSFKRGWSDIGYHYLIDLSGNIYQGRAYISSSSGEQLTLGAHTKGNNSGSIGICVLGCFQSGNDICESTVPISVVAALRAICVSFCMHYNIAPINIFGHCDLVIETTCPGNLLLSELESLRCYVAREIARSGSSTTNFTSGLRA